MNDWISVTNRLPEPNQRIARMESKDLREALASLSHEIWAHWMKYMFSQGTHTDRGNWFLPPKLVDRWTRQLKTNYADLTFKEQKSDQDQADKILKLLHMYDVIPGP